MKRDYTDSTDNTLQMAINTIIRYYYNITVTSNTIWQLVPARDVDRDIFHEDV